MKPLAIIPVFNEADILPWTIKHLKEQGCEVYVLDNWSRDGSTHKAFLADCEFEHWPAEPQDVYDWTGILKRCEEIAIEQCGSGRWVMVNDADEIRRSPDTLPLDVTMRWLTECGFNAVEFHQFHFWPIDNGWTPEKDPEQYFRHYSEDAPGWQHVKAWFQVPDRSVDLHTAGGHQAFFKEMRVCDAPFYLKHYPIRSQQHGEKKILRERLPRYPQAELARGWHVHYNEFRGERPSFLKDPKELKEWK